MSEADPPKTPADAMQRLRRLVERLRSASEEPPPVAEALPPEPPAPDLESLTGRIRAKVSARRAGVADWASSVIDVAQLAATEPALPRFAQAPQRIEIRDRYTLGELMSCSDADFIHNAYRALLKRDADAQGYLHNYSLLARGSVSRLETLRQFRDSDEAQRHKVRIEGLDRALLLKRLSRWPIIGGLVSLALELRNLPITAARLEAQERKLLGVEHELRNAIDSLAQASESFVKVFSERSAAALGTLEKTSRIQAMSLTSRVAALRLEIAGLNHEARRRATREDLLQVVESLISAMTELDRRKVDVEAGDPDFDAFYLEFENTFRGPRADIKARNAVYLPIVQATPGSDARVVDLGCGRGEWLELLKESGMPAVGVDMNPRMVKECVALGLQVTEGDAIEFLGALPAGSIRAVTGMHIIEHLPYRRVLALLDEARRVLRPGGVAVFETPNPENVIVGSCNFWYDPTHERPLPPEPLKRAAELRGFSRVEILRLHPFPVEAHFASASGVRDELNHLFYGPQDYAILAYKGDAESGR
jgi:SAM-dependent methyltransferase